MIITSGLVPNTIINTTSKIANETREEIIHISTKEEIIHVCYFQ
jgi:hypothetical protein